MKNIIFIHGLESSGKGFKALLLRKIIPEILTPDFEKYEQQKSLEDLFNARMTQLNNILCERTSWVIIGSSFGGLMSAIYAMENPTNVKQLILLAPFLESRKLKPSRYKAKDVPVIIYHGSKDKVVRYKGSKERAQKLFTNLKYNIVNDNHSLHNTVKLLNWKNLILKD